MIHYKSGGWGVMFSFSMQGSVFPKAICWALPNGILAGVLTHLLSEFAAQARITETAGVNVLWSGYTVILGFLVVFRNNEAYSRFWEGTTLLHQTRGEWTEAISNLIGFCSKSKEKGPQVEEFQGRIVRLGSLLYCSALQQICDLEDDTLDVIDIDFLDGETVDFLMNSNDKCEVIMQWIRRLIYDAEADGSIQVAPPILSRSYQELSRGMVNLINVRKIKDIPFPFPYAQMITWMLMVHWWLTPVLASQIVSQWYWSALLCFTISLGMWSLMYIALEIEQPFGADANDLPVAELMRDFNRSMLNLCDPLAQQVPRCTWSTGEPSISLSTTVLGSGDPIGRMSSRRFSATTQKLSDVPEGTDGATLSVLWNGDKYSEPCGVPSQSRKSTARKKPAQERPPHGEPGKEKAEIAEDLAAEQLRAGRNPDGHCLFEMLDGSRHGPARHPAPDTGTHMPSTPSVSSSTRPRQQEVTSDKDSQRGATPMSAKHLKAVPLCGAGAQGATAQGAGAQGSRAKGAGAKADVAQVDAAEGAATARGMDVHI
mmetsp:Transcript_17693/g.37604  ORF Transcript_17693/g.37604 Transcript_17693/m.37604 type:complete len:542 (+) Transcript_17693:100-1725(+)